MCRRVKENWDYKLLHTSGIKVVKNMSEQLKQNELDAVSDITDYIEDHNEQDFERSLEVIQTIKEFEDLVARYKMCTTELKLALGSKYEDTYAGREEFSKTNRRYLRNLRIRARELDRESEQQAEEKAAAHEEKRLLQAAKAK